MRTTTEAYVHVLTTMTSCHGRLSYRIIAPSVVSSSQKFT